MGWDTHSHTHKQTCTLLHIVTHLHTNTHTLLHTVTYPQTHFYTQSHTCTETHSHILSHTGTHSRVQRHIHMHACTRTGVHRHTHVHTCAHTHFSLWLCLERVLCRFYSFFVQMKKLRHSWYCQSVTEPGLRPTATGIQAHLAKNV